MTATAAEPTGADTDPDDTRPEETENDSSRRRKQLLRTILPVCSCGLVTGIVLGAGIFALIIHLRTSGTDDDDTRTISPGFSIVPLTDVCFSQGCERSARLLRALLNPYVEPCRDFFEYVCGRFESSYGTLTKETEASLRTVAIAQMIKVPVPATGQTATEKAAGHLLACAGMQNRAGSNDNQVLKDFIQKEGLALDTNDNTDAMGRIFKLSLLYGVDMLFTASVEMPLWTAVDKRAIVIAFNSELAQWLSSPRTPTDYTARLAQFVTNSGHLPDLFKDIIAFEKKAASYITQLQGTDVVQPMAIRDFGNKGRSITSNEWLAIVTASAGPRYTENDRLWVNEPTLDYTSTMKKEFDNAKLNFLLTWHVIRQLITYSDPQFGSTDSQYVVSCIRLVHSAMESTYAAAFFSLLLTPDIEEVANNITLDVRDELVLQAKASKNLPQRDASVKKLTDMQFIVGLPNGFRNRANFDRFWAAAPDASVHFLSAWLPTYRYYVTQLLAQPHIAVFPMFALRTYYDATNGRVFVPPSLLTSTYLNISTAPVLNYAGLGHAAGCAAAQAIEATATGQCPPEGAAEVEGLRAAYSVYTRRYGSKSVKRLPLLSIHPKRLFFAAACLKMCHVRKFPGGHGAGSCNNLVASVDGFQDSFTCPAGSPMNPAQKCAAW
ncbi:endothelin-converting enzyme 1-like [Ornithodoros turicata]|uniref:endothelin-converting enzyme 1-like n=1 Tax=Ornithodoros turicata TaxID=34597 RepID=UPI00313861D6